MKKEIEDRLEQLKVDAQQPYVDSSVRAKAVERYDKLEEFYDLMYGY